MLFRVRRVHHRHFMDTAKQLRAAKHTLAYLRLLPRTHQDQRLFHMSMNVFAAARDLDSALAAIDLAKRNKVLVDERLLTQLMKGATIARAPLSHLGPQCAQRAHGQQHLDALCWRLARMACLDLPMSCAQSSELMPC